MNKVHFSSRIVMLALILGLVASTASAIGVTPSRVTADFVPGETFESSACFETGGITYLKIQKIGVLENNIDIIGPGSDGDLDTLKEGNCINYVVRLPQRFEKPGVQYSGISAVEVPADNGATIYAVAKIIHQIFIIVPYPGKYLETGQLVVNNVPAGEDANMAVSVENKGSETIKSVTATITIYDRNNLPLGTIKSNTLTDFAPNSQQLLTASWDSGSNKQGNYNAKAHIVYDGSDVNLSSDFKLGGLDLTVANYSQEIVIGGIKPFYVIVDSIWSENIQAKASILVYNGTETNVLQQFDTVTKTVQAWNMQELQGYINTDSLGVGEFDVKIILEFEGTTKSVTGKLKIIAPPKAEEPKKELNLLSTRNIVIAMAIILVIILALAAKELIPRKKGPESQPMPPK